MQYAELYGQWVFGWSLGYNCFRDEPNTVRHANVTLITADRLSREQFDSDDPFCDVSPDVVVEVFGMDDSASDLAEAFDAWFRAGTRLAWLVDPRARTVASHRPDGTVLIHDSSDTLTATDVLPGFAYPVTELFRIPMRTVPV